jgi:hypothetical protein
MTTLPTPRIAAIGDALLRAAAREAHPNDYYAQTVMIMGWDPLAGRPERLLPKDIGVEDDPEYSAALLRPDQ